jgi:hypothetical protein
MGKRLLCLIFGISFLEIAFFFLYLLFIMVMTATDGHSSLDVRPIIYFSLTAFILSLFFAFLCFRPKK